jgi:hypothetical protein
MVKISIFKGGGTNKRLQTITQHSCDYLFVHIAMKRSSFICFKLILQISAELSCFSVYQLKVSELKLNFWH